MTTKVKPTLEGFHTATPYLSIRNASKAIEFYEKAFGAKELTRLAQPDGRIGHAEIKIGDASIMIADEFPRRPELGGLCSPHSLGGTSVLVHVYVEDVDALANQLCLLVQRRLLRWRISSTGTGASDWPTPLDTFGCSQHARKMYRPMR